MPVLIILIFTGTKQVNLIIPVRFYFGSFRSGKNIHNMAGLVSLFGFFNGFQNEMNGVLAFKFFFRIPAIIAHPTTVIAIKFFAKIMENEFSSAHAVFCVRNYFL